ncbi:MAG: MFS transporter [Dehalococcoidia bacterium]|nr:MFS transporter [Dehalococcoidia bacterium]MDW8120650.1 MFS transporter [Chloroflexota bacterium]
MRISHTGEAPPAPLRSALGFVLLLGVVSLCADVAYEGARSITGPFLAHLGASAATVGVVAGLGEVMGYALRLPAGYLADRTRRYWPIAMLGYAVNMTAVPLLALASRWDVASALIVAERIGKGVRTPARDTMLSYAAARLGRGWAFGLHEALDQIGAVAGPLVVAGALALGGGYRWAFAILAVPAGMALLVLALARWQYPHPQRLEPPSPVPAQASRLSPRFWLYIAFIALAVAGFAHFQVMGFHFKQAGVVAEVHIPLLFALAMGVDALAGLALGRWFDRVGLRSLLVVPLLSLPIAPLVFSASAGMALAGVLLWGVVLGAQETVCKAAVVSLAPPERRGWAFGVFNAAYGIAWMVGSAAMGALYEAGIGWVVGFAVALEALAIPVVWLVVRREGQKG